MLEWPIVTGSLVVSFLSLLSGLFFIVRLYIPSEKPAARVVLILPLTGRAQKLEMILGELSRQEFLPRRLIIAVESRDDLAYGRALSVSKSPWPFSIDIVVAGLAEKQAQKCRNQQAALEHILPTDDVIASMDGDIQVGRRWLADLVGPLESDQFDLVTGRRWQRVERHRLGAHLTACIDRALSLLPRFNFDLARIVWGGSFAMSTKTAARIDLSSTISSVVTDDLVIGDRATACGLRVATRSALLVPSPTDQTFVAAWRFARRQYQLGRIYRPGLWLFALLTILLRLAGWTVAIAEFLMTGAFWWALLALSTLGLLKQIVVADVARRVGLPDPAGVRIVQYALGVLQPVADLFHLSVIIAGGWTRIVRWGHVTYEVTAKDHIRVTERRPFST